MLYLIEWVNFFVFNTVKDDKMISHFDILSSQVCTRLNTIIDYQFLLKNLFIVFFSLSLFKQNKKKRLNERIKYLISFAYTHLNFFLNFFVLFKKLNIFLLF
jgi:hypothetical protein